MTKVQYAYPYPAACLNDTFMVRGGQPGKHLGVDYAPEGGGPAKAIADGVVVLSRWSPGMGWSVVLKHADGKFSSYNHLERQGRTSGFVPRGGTVGIIGNTGIFSKGRHLHLTVGTTIDCWQGLHVIDPLEWIRLNQEPVVRPAGVGERDWQWWIPVRAVRRRIQKALAARGRYNLASGKARPIDGLWGRFTIEGIQITLRQAGYLNVKVTGTPDRATCEALQLYGKRFGDYTGYLDRKLGPASWLAFAVGLERP